MIYGGLFLALVGIGVGCKKDDSNIMNRNQNSTAKFDSSDELKAKLEMIEAMSEEDRVAYETQNKFKSLFTKVYETYCEIDMENLANEKLLYEHVEKNKDLIEIIKNSSGELEYRPIYSNNPYSLIAGENRMIIAGETCIKVFDDGIISTSLEKFDELNAFNHKLASNFTKQEDFDVMIYKYNDITPKSSCPNEAERRVDNGRNRTRLRIGNGYTQVNSSSGQTWATLCWIEVRPFMRTLGVWYHAQRTISGAITATIGYNNGSPQSHNVSRTIAPTLSYVQTRNAYTPVSGFPSNVHFVNYNAWGTTPSTGTATLTCN